MGKVFPFEGYTVAKVIEENENSKHYIAASKEREGTFLISEFYERDSINLFLADFVYITQSKMSELVECFSQNSVFYAVFKYTSGTALLKLLDKDKLELDYRINIARAIVLKAMEMGNVPLLIQRAALTPSNIVINEGGIFFNFKMDLYSMKGFKDRSIYYDIGELLTELFTYKEIEKNSRLKVVLEKCQKDVYESFGEVIKDFDIVSKEKEESLNIKAVAEEKKKTVIKKIQGILAAAAILIGILTLYIVYVANVNKDVVVFAPVEEIGTVSVLEKETEYITEESQNKTVYIYDSDNEKEKPAVEPTPTPSSELQEESKPNESELKDEPPLEEALELKDIVYIVKPGDNLYTICKEYYGRPYEYVRVSQYNGLTSPRSIFPNQEILLPPPITDLD